MHDFGLVPVRATGSGLLAGVTAIAILIVILVSAHFSETSKLSLILVPAAGVMAAIGIGRHLARRHPAEPWLVGTLVLGVCAKMVGSALRYRSLIDSYGTVGDATVYDKYGRRFVAFWTQAGPEPYLDDLRKSNFVRWLTGVVYYLFGVDMIVGFMVFGLVAIIGSYLWYRATVEAVPFLNARLYMLLMFFAPSILFWPSSIGKESLMQFGIGSAALGTAHILNGRLVRGLLVALPGAWLMWVVRPHLLALVTLVASFAYIFGRRRRSVATGGGGIWKPVGLIVLGLLTVFAVGQGTKSLGLDTLSLESIDSELETTSLSTGQGGSAFDPGDTSVTPIAVPRGLATVLLRPFPWEAGGGMQLLASLEGVLLTFFIVARRKSIALSLRRMRSTPFLLYCWTLTLLYSLTFQAFANFGLLVRQRSLVLPALYVLLCLAPDRLTDEKADAELGAREDDRHDEVSGRAAADGFPYLVPYGIG